VAQVLNAVLNLVLALLIITGQVNTWHVYLTGFLVAIVQVFEMPARQAMVSESVDRQYLTNAIGLNSIAWNISQSLGPAAAGILIALMGVGGSYIVQGLIYAISTIWTVQLTIGHESFADRRAGQSLYRGVIDGWRYILRHPTIRGAMTMAVLISLFGISFTVLLPAFARDILNVGATGQGLLVTASGLGAFLGSLCIAGFGDRLPKGRLMLGGALLFGLTEIAFGFSTWFPLSFALMAISGLVGLTCTALVNTVLQGHSEPGMRGRVMAAFQQAHQGMTIGGLFIGALAAVVGPGAAVAMMGGACLLGVLAVALTQPNVRAIQE
jgi:MFS family permease